MGFEDEDDLVLEGLGIGVEVLVEAARGLGLKEDHLGEGGVWGEGDGGGNGAGGRGDGVDVPVFGEGALEFGVDGGAGGSGGGDDLKGPLDGVEALGGEG